MSTAFAAFRDDCRQRVERQMRRHLEARGFAAAKLEKAILYLVPDGGKRVRPLLVYGGCRALGGAFKNADAAACAVEYLHAYTLIHDDLPSLDDDDLRRGKPTLHKVFDEATAILAGNALHALAFEILSEADTDGSLQARMVHELAVASVAAVCGQQLDLDAGNRTIPETELESLHRLKTGALIEASVVLGAMSTGTATAEQLARLREYSHAVGLAFQIQDDILDEISDTETLGKPQGSDREACKATYVTLLGLEPARARTEELAAEASRALADFGEAAEPLRLLAKFIVDRIN